MAMNVTVEVTVRDKPPWRRILRNPVDVWRPYRYLRGCGYDVPVSLIGAWIIAGKSVIVNGRETNWSRTWPFTTGS